MAASRSRAAFAPPAPLTRAAHNARVRSRAAPLRRGRRFAAACAARPTPAALDATDAVDPAEVPDTDLSERQRRAQRLSASAPAPAAIPTPPAPTVVEVEFAPGKTVRFETGRMARQASGAVLARIGETIVFCAACADSSAAATVDFLPLRVDYAEKFSATGKTAGSYIKREGRPSEREILVSRLIDRPLRPMFADGYFNEVQVLANVFSYDGKNPADALAICSAAAALHISHIPLVAPVAAVRLAHVNGAFVVEPTVQELKDCESELVVAGTRDGILMIEGFCDFLSEDQIVAGVELAHASIVKLCDALDELREKTGSVEKITDALRTIPAETNARMVELSAGIDEALAVIGKKDREEFVREVRNRVFDALKPTREEELADPDAAAEKVTLLRIAWKELVSERMRRRILDHNVRPDGRDSSTVRPISIDQALLPHTHGSSLFTRGETQTLAVATLGGDDMAQRFETLEGEDAARFYLQYSFPPFSVGEVGRVGAPGRREIGHGKLAERALQAAIPPKEEFPYVLRVESNILESNGSSSMASVCGGCLALLEAGVPLKCSVAGIAMGLVVDKSAGPDLETGELPAVVLTDILGLEDALGSCDAKFAGNRDGLSALQLDVKLRGISLPLFGQILTEARAGRLHVLDCMDAVMPQAKTELPSSVPKMEVIQIPPKRIGEVIGPGGKTVRSIIEKCGGEEEMRISIDNDGSVSFSSSDVEMIKKAKGIVRGMTMTVDVGTRLQGKVTKILPFGAYVQVAEGKEGWLHISELESKRTSSVTDVCNVGDVIEVKVIELGRNGQMKLSRKACEAVDTTQSEKEKERKRVRPPTSNSE